MMSEEGKSSSKMMQEATPEATSSSSDRLLLVALVLSWQTNLSSLAQRKPELIEKFHRKGICLQRRNHQQQRINDDCHRFIETTNKNIKFANSNNNNNNYLYYDTKLKRELSSSTTFSKEFFNYSTNQEEEEEEEEDKKAYLVNSQEVKSSISSTLLDLCKRAANRQHAANEEEDDEKELLKPSCLYFLGRHFDASLDRIDEFLDYLSSYTPYWKRYSLIGLVCFVFTVKSSTILRNFVLTLFGYFIRQEILLWLVNLIDHFI